MSWFNSIIITWHGGKRSTIEDSFNLYHNGCEFLKGELSVKEDMTEMSFHGFLQLTPTKMSAGMNFHSIPRDELKSEMVSWFFWCFRNSNSSFVSQVVPTKLVT